MQKGSEREWISSQEDTGSSTERGGSSTCCSGTQNLPCWVLRVLPLCSLHNYHQSPCIPDVRRSSEELDFAWLFTVEK